MKPKEAKELQKENERLRAALTRLRQAALPDPYDERETDPKWLREQIFRECEALEKHN
jgi:hypothetical protein